MYRTVGEEVFPFLRRLYESPFTDRAPTGPDYVYPERDIDVIVDTLRHITRTAAPEEGQHASPWWPDPPR